MKKIFLLFLSVICFSSFSQLIDLNMKSGDFVINQNLDSDISDSDSYRMLFFNKLPTENQKDNLEQLGVKFLYYLPKNIFVVNLEQNLTQNNLSEFDITSINPILSSYKIDFKLQKDTFPSWSIKHDLLHIKLLLFKDVDISSIIEQVILVSDNVEEINENSKSITIAIDPTNLITIANLSFVSYIEPIDAPGEPENYSGRTLHRTNVINTDYVTGRNYNGEGVNVVMQDDGYIQPHIDRQGRIDETFCNGCSSSSGNDHGDHCSGTIMGAGNLDPKGKGMADGSFLYTMGYSTQNYTNSNAFPLLHTNYDVVITSTSYSNGCNAGYTSLARDIDEQNNNYPSLIHIFSAGNNGSSSCTDPYISGTSGANWGNVTGGHKQAKNVIAVANLTSTSGLANSSSRGPAADGRIKPDIGAKGSSVYSTEHNNTYGTKTGTSMSCPGIAGIMAQLYQAYREVNNVTNPPSALMKCIMLNSADDIGNPGPDFRHGWGEVNAYRAVRMIENGHHFDGSISQSSNNTYTINVPANLSRVKVMVYWHDKEASTSASISLVNDIDIQLTTPGGASYNPWVLDPTPNSTLLNLDAVRGFDYLNNMEQVTIDNPPAGNYTLSIDGYAIPYGPQQYYVTYEFIDSDVELTYPIGGEGLVPLETEYLRWDSDHNQGLIDIEYSTNGGNSWSSIATNVQITNRYYSWQVPNVVTDNALIRITANNNISQSLFPFTIIDVPSNLSVYWPCPDSINVSWNAVNGATSYEISMLGQKYMDSIFTTTNTNVWVINPNPNVTDSWFSVRSKMNNGKGRREIAVNAQSINSICSGYGCTDPVAYNYTVLATVNDGSCCYVAGCTNISSVNYDSTACYDDGSCVSAILGCTNPNATNFDPLANTNLWYGGAPDNTFGTGGFFNGDQHLIFDAFKECIIRSSMIYSEGSNNITFELRNSVGNVIDDTTLSVSSGQQRIDLNFDVPIANDMQLGVNIGALSNVGLYRNNASANYPYNIGSAINITSSSATSAPYGYYYFYYDIEVETPCEGIVVTSSWDCDGQGNCSDPGTGNGQYLTQSLCQQNCIVPSWDCTNGICIDPGTGNGIYASLNACQQNCIVQSWDCTNGVCIDPGTGNGQYTTQSACQSNCITPSWDCDGQGTCSDPGTGNGQYLTQLLCQQNCIVPSWNCTNGTCIDPGTGNGTYASLSVCQSNCVSVTYDCINNICIDPGTGNGTYASLSACQQNCIVPSWDCTNGICIDPGTGNGTYASLSTCQSNCVSVTYDCINNTCIDPGTGNGIYASLNACQSNCIIPSWDCDGQGNCVDPGTGNGQYFSLISCESECSYVSVHDIGLTSFKIYPNPSRDIFNVSFSSEIKQFIQVRLVNLVGEIIFTENLENFEGEYSHSFNLSEYSKGIYLLELDADNGIINKKLILQ